MLKLDDDLERSFLEQQAILDRWSVPELKRQKAASLFLRLAASKDKTGFLQLANQGQIVERSANLLREPHVFEFLKIRKLSTTASCAVSRNIDFICPSGKNCAGSLN